MIYLLSFCLLLTHLWIGSIGCAVYHIILSPDHYCPAEPCLTLPSFVANVSLYLESNTLLIFQPGNHVIHSKLSITDVVNFSMISNHSRTGITCENDSRPKFIFEAVNHVYVRNINFLECRGEIYRFFIKLITVTASSLVLVKCNFEDNARIDVISAAHSNITIAQSIFKNNIEYEILTFYHCNATIVSTTFIDNAGNLLHERNPTFRLDIDAIMTVSTLTIMSCEFRNNYLNNSQCILDMPISDISIYDTKFVGNKACVLKAFESVINTDNSTFKRNYGLAMHLTYCKVDIHNSVFNNNEDGALRLWSTIAHIYGSEFRENIAKSTGGAIQCSSGLVSFSETCILADNQAKQGGAIYLSYRVRCFAANGATVIIANNTASEFGGGIYLDHHSNLTLRSQSTLWILENWATADGGGIYLDDHSNITLRSHSTLQILENRAKDKGGGIYASESSFINLGFKSHDIGQISNSNIYFYRNQARKGGGLYLGLNSIVYAFPCLNSIAKFDKNSADYGGAVYVYAKTTLQYYYSNPECFFQSLRNPAQRYNSNSTIKCSNLEKFPFHFSLNRANYSGFSLHKVAFNNCSIDGRSFEEFKLLSIISNIQTSDIGSSLVQICYCEKGIPKCAKQIPFIDIKTEQKVALEVAIVDRGNHIVSGSIESEIRGSVQIRDDQKIQKIINGCTQLILTILYSLDTSQQLILSPQLDEGSTYITTVRSKRSIKLNFLACTDCPIGFQQIKDDARGCDCVCNVVLESYIIGCNYTRETITKKGTTAWISYLSTKNTSGYLIYPYCPMDYCLPPDVTVEINLNLPNGADAQCAHDHTGLLCGTCSPGLSLSLGSSHCLQCHTHWPGVLVVIITSSLLAGLILVSSLLMLNLTVANGTLNGLIFYANIVATNRYKFFPSTSFVTAFVSWFNLEMGIDTCFFDGMDLYWKTWIELAFPTYILVLVVLVIVFSECSVKFARIVGKRNPIATLDTLILLCYVKFLRTVIIAFSFVTLDYPDGSHPVVWWPDATVGYFSGKHIVLWAVAAIIFLVGLFYTVLLFSWQWLLYYQHKTILKWIQTQRLRMFIEPYHAPYAFKHRYWTGLLLLVRVAIYIVSAADVSGDRGITLLAIGIIAIILLILVSCRPYKSWPVEVLEIGCYANIAGLCLATLYVSKVRKSQEAVGYISGTITLVLLLIVLTYHVVTQLFFKTKLGKKFKKKFNHQLNDSENEEQVSFVTTQDSEEGKPATYSEVDPPPRRDAVPLSYFVNLRSRRSTIDSVPGSAANYEENELRPIEQAINSSTPYSLMK